MSPNKSILAAIDLTAGSRPALQQAARLASATQARFEVLHVVDQLVVDDFAEAMGKQTLAVRTQVNDDARAELRDFVDKSSLSKPPDTLEVAIGTPLVEVIRYVSQRKPWLLVVGRNGATSPHRGPGMLAVRCARKAPCTVLVVPRDVAGRLARIVVGIDFSGHSLEALRQAMALAEVESAQVQAVHTFFGPWNKLHYRAPTPEATPEFEQQYAQVLESRLRHFVEPAQRDYSSVPLETHLAHDYSNPGFALLNWLERMRADLVVVSTHGRTGIAKLLMGSTAERILYEASGAVMIVKPEGFEYAIE